MVSQRVTLSIPKGLCEEVRPVESSYYESLAEAFVLAGGESLPRRVLSRQLLASGRTINGTLRD